MEIVLTDVAYDDPSAVAMIAELQQEYVERYGGPDETPLQGGQFAAPDGAFVIAHSGDEAIGCAGLRRHDDDAVEIKRMFVRRAHRRRGHARRMLRALEERARTMGYRRVVLESGTAQPEAIALYTAEGYAPIPGFGHYRRAAGNRCFAKDL